MKLRKGSFSSGFSTQFAKKNAYFAAKIAKNPAFHPSLLAAFSLFLGLLAGTYIIPTNATYANAKIDAPASATSTDHSDPISEKQAIEKVETKTLATRGGSSTATATSTRATASASTASAALSIPALGINTGVSASSLSNKELSVPTSSVSYYGTLLMGHSSGVFANLPSARAGQEINYFGKTYVIDSVRINLPVSSDRQKVGNFSMYVLTNLGSNRIVLMTCAGSYQAGFGWTGRTLVFATLK